MADRDVPTRSEIAARLHRLANHIISVAVDIEYYGGMAFLAKHSRELLGAGHLARSWAAEIEKQAHTAIPLTDIEQKCPDCLTPPGTRCESAPGNCPYRQAHQDAESA